MAGQSRLKDLFVDVPVRPGKGGVKGIVEPELDTDEKAQPATSAHDVRHPLEDLGRLMQF